MTYTSKVAALDRLYRQVPRVPDCKRECHTSCGTILMADVELARIEKRIGREYRPAPLGADCSLLRGGLCSVYQLRPMVCRLWGVMEGMECPYGCTPERLLSYEEAMVFLAKADAISKGEDPEAVAEQVLRGMRESPGRFALTKMMVKSPKDDRR